MKRLSVALLVITALCVGVLLNGRAGQAEDHLVPLEKTHGSGDAYQRLWREKLLVTPAETARFVGLPGTIGVETAVSVYRAPGKPNSLPGDYWVTATQASDRLWNSVQPDVEGHVVNPETIRVERCDAPIEESTALAMHEVWLAMLSQARPAPASNAIVVDSSREIFSAANSSGVLLEAESSITPKKNTKALVKMALSLMEYCDANASRRAEIARTIEKDALNLVARIASSSRRKKVEPASSPKSAITPER